MKIIKEVSLAFTNDFNKLKRLYIDTKRMLASSNIIHFTPLASAMEKYGMR